MNKTVDINKPIQFGEDTNYAIDITPHPKKHSQAKYTFFRNGQKIGEYTGRLPLELGATTNIGKEIRKHLNPNKRLSADAVNHDFDDLKAILHQKLQALLNLEKQEELEQKRARDHEKAERINKAKKILPTLKQPVVWVASHIDWLTAGERNNILLAWIAYCSQIILHEPISIIALGEGGSGKTHIINTALELIPEEYIQYEKNITESAMFRRSEDDPWFYDHKIVNYGDLGGLNEQEFIAESKNRIKELQSDGYLNRPISIPSEDGGWEVMDMTLMGRPALTYTTVPGYKFDDQEISRSLFLTPRMNNKESFNTRLMSLEIKGESYQKFLRYHEEAEIIPEMVEILEKKFQEIEIINPYIGLVVESLGDSIYYKRDSDKYNNIIKTISALNYYNREIFEKDGQKYLYVTLEDVQLFFSLINRYRESINMNISPKAVDVLNEINDKYFELTENQKGNDDEYQVTFQDGFTVNRFEEVSELGLSRRSIYRYIDELREAKLLSVKDRGRTGNLYDLTMRKGKEWIDTLQLSEGSKRIVILEAGEEMERFLAKDKVCEGLSIFNQDPLVERPFWAECDKEA